MFNKSELSLEEIAQIEDPIEGYEELDAWIWNNSKEDDEYEANPTAIKEYIAIWWLDSELYNGGFHQFLWNYTGRYAPSALIGLNKIGAHETASILNSVLELFGTVNYPLDDNLRTDVLDSFDKTKNEQIDRFSDEYCECNENLKELLFDYFRNNIDEFKIIETSMQSEKQENAFCPFCGTTIDDDSKTCDQDECVEKSIKLKM